MRERENMTLMTHHPDYGRVIKNPDGTLICHICGKSFRKLGAHVVQKHQMVSWQYKIAYGLNTNQGLITDEHKQHLSDCVKRNYDSVVQENLIEGGLLTRFAPNSRGRTRDQLSEQTRQGLVERGKKSIKNIKRHKIHEEKEHKIKNKE
jgi:hypothetical protein